MSYASDLLGNLCIGVMLVMLIKEVTVFTKQKDISLNNRSSVPNVLTLH